MFPASVRRALRMGDKGDGTGQVSDSGCCS